MKEHIQGNLQDMVVELGEAWCGDAHGGSFLDLYREERTGDKRERGGGGAGRGEEQGAREQPLIHQEGGSGVEAGHGDTAAWWPWRHAVRACWLQGRRWQ